MAIFANPTKKAASYGGLDIVRLEPTDQKIVVDYVFEGDALSHIKCFVYSKDNIVTPLFDLTQQGESYGSFTITPIYNHTDYIVILKAFCGTKEVASSNYRIVRCGFVPGRVINYIHPEDYTFNTSGRSPASPSIIRAADGNLYASHDIYWGDHGQNLTHVFKSENDGDTWKFVSSIYPSFWTKLFEHKGKLYALGTSCEYGDLNLFESSDAAKTWSEPVKILGGKGKEEGGAHKAPMPVIISNGRFWTGIDYGSWSLPEKHGSGAVSCAVDVDIMNGENWKCTGFIRQDETWVGAPTPVENARGTLEGNMVVGRDGEVYNFLRYQNEHCTPNYAKAVMIKMDKDDPEKLPTFHKFIDFRGNLTKFDIVYDDRTDKYYSLVNDVTQKENCKQRNNLSLMVSDDLNSWRLLRGILNYEDNCFTETSAKVGFQYVAFIFDGEDILAASRTALNDAYNFHNANYLTFHRIKDYDISL